ncbi:MAG: isocitrate lyase/phosphoenolpyruvate mutase family protein [Rhizobiales bacterium]|nr:isocitrate lyase/phosphoenolpyruvate mutase family protein [Hyphomicrobiales bacterium]NRB15724.1 isocitrate lyase/phosphoenolpyruvate mutase family protein [Hyphomicrobiales bacterium]
MNLQKKAEQLLALHHGDKMLILPNITTPMGARILQDREFGAVATPSAGIAEQLGLQDGEIVPFEVLLFVLKQIVEATDLPVTADIERGYAADLGHLKQNISQLLNVGIVGVNVEDSLHEQSEKQGLRDLAEQMKRIAAIRASAEQQRVHLVINARIDVFVACPKLSLDEKIATAIERAAAYKAAGADVIYPIGAKTETTIEQLLTAIDLPLNILALPDALPLRKLEQMGVARVSLGPFLYRATVGTMIEVIDAMQAYGDYGVFNDRIPKDGLGKFLKP